MFDPTDHPRIFGLAPGVDFPQALIDGTLSHLGTHPPEELARAHIIVNTRRMARRIRQLFDQGPARILPKISLVTELAESFALHDIPRPISPLRRRLELAQLISGLLEQQRDLAPRSALYDLADSLANLMDEMQGEGVSPDVIKGLDVSDQSGHWARILGFLDIVKSVYATDRDQPDAEDLQRQTILRLIALWQVSPPKHPVILAGSTGSRGSTLMLMQAIARLPQGAVVLPGYDFDMTSEVWNALKVDRANALPLEDHPQYRFHRMLSEMDMQFDQVTPWHDAPAPDPARNAMMSLALRPVPVTDQWLRDGPKLGRLDQITDRMTLLEAPSSRIEALCIAMKLREAAENEVTAALITPDRGLTRQVTAALDRWGIVPDDSAGRPLHLSPPGRFLRHVIDLACQRLTAEQVLTLLKHPLAHSGGKRGAHLRLTRELELHIRDVGMPFPTAQALQDWAADENDPFAKPWAEWLCFCLMDQLQTMPLALSDQVTRHMALAEQIADGSAPERQSELWKDTAGRTAWDTTRHLIEQAPHGGVISAQDYAALFYSVFSNEDVRNPQTPHPKILIWGTLEARVQGADLVILAGLNEGSWPAVPSPDPWLNRALRHQAGLLVPERRIGLAAHDFQQAVAAKEVWISRSVRSDDTETVASRWVNRLTNLLSGLPDQGGEAALNAMRKRGVLWMQKAAVLETPLPADPAPRPAPCPAPAVRPNRLSVTEIQRLIRDPYAIYAKHILRLRPLNPLMRAPDAMLRGIVLHRVLEEFIRDTANAPEQCNRNVLMGKAVSILAQNVPWAETRTAWLARLERVADWFIDTEHQRRALAKPTTFEVKGRARIEALDFTLSAEADRIDMDEAGHLHIYDYKTGKPPSPDEQRYFDKQLLLEAAIAETAGFGDLSPSPVERAMFIGLSNDAREVAAPLQEEPTQKVWDELQTLIQTYQNADTGYTARRAMKTTSDVSDYDQLARFGEWDIVATPDKAVLK
ncbi:MAG: double-strand break repair protein AddB [Roseovarius sp.]